MSYKKLETHTPVLNSYCYYGSLTAILQGTGDFKHWLYSNFVSFRISRSKVICYGKPMSPTFYTPWTKKHSYSRDMIKHKWNSISEFIIDSIDMNHYLFLKVNRKYIKAFSGYDKWNSVHEQLVYGYDKEKQIFHVADNFQYGKFTFAQCSFDEFAKAYEETDRDSYGGVILASTDFSKPYQFDLAQLRERLEEYLNPQKSIFTYNPLPMGALIHDLQNDPCGFDVYRTVLKDIREKLETEERPKLDVRMTYLLWEHKDLMCSRLIYLREEQNLALSENLYKEMEDVRELFRIILNLSLKYKVKGDRAILPRICTLMEKGMSREKEVILKVIEAIDVRTGMEYN
ncbi:MAG: hypothetical protein PQJ59_12685 [Spirochaetales bacterium]|nr:hypothetical protein [Spirochaetales bacterium]